MQCFFHKKKSAKAIPKYVNVSKVEDYHRDGSNIPASSGIDPYTRLASTDGCGGFVTCGTYVAGNTNPLCDGWDWYNAGVGVVNPEIHSCAGGTVASYRNCYSQSGTIDLSGTCRAKGRRAVRAQKILQGAPPLDDTDFLNSCSIATNPTTTRYLTRKLSVTAHYFYFGIAPPDVSTEDFEFTNQKTINRYSGKVTPDSIVITAITKDADGTVINNYSPSDITNQIATHCGGAAGICATTDINQFLLMSYDCSGNLANGGNDTYGWITRWLSTLNQLWNGTYTWAGFPDPHYVMSGKVATSTKLAFTVTVTQQTGDTLTVNYDCELSNPYTAAQATQDGYDLLNWWPLNDDPTWSYKWYGDDDLVTWCPMVVYDETQGDNTTFTYDPTWTDPTPCTGNIMGKPNPSGYEPHFDFFGRGSNGSTAQGHRIYDFCILSLALKAFVKTYGAKISDSVFTSALPPNATLWTDDLQAAEGYAGAWVKNTGPLIEMQKWAEVDMIWPSTNFARPCGNDLWDYDEPNTGTITNVAGSVLMVTFEVGTPAIPTGSKCIVCGTGSVDGMWTVTNNGGGTWTLNSLISALPAGFTCSGNPAGMCFGLARWPTATTCNATWNSTKPRRTYAMFQYTHNYRDITIDPTLRATQQTNGMPQTVDTFNQATVNYTWNRCNPVVMAISPNGETWTSGNTTAFPAASAIRYDEIYGAGIASGATADAPGYPAWQAVPMQAMPDPFYQTPHRDCYLTGIYGGFAGWTWNEDDGTCLVDSAPTYYYAHRPLVEGRVDLPAGAPALPAGVYIGGLTLAQLAVASPHGIVYPPPQAPGYTVTGVPASTQIWTTWLNICGCINLSGRFAAQYIADNYVCS